MDGGNSVAIVGGGITGLTAAWQFQKAGIPVTLYESGDRVGGVIQTIKRDGYMAEFGPNTVLETSPKIAALVDELGLTRVYSDPAAEARYLVRNKKLVPLPGSPLAFMGSSLFSWKAKLRLMREPFIGAGGEKEDESLADFVLRRLGREFLDYAINPFVAGVYAGDPTRLSVRYAFPKLFALERKYGSLIKGQIRGAKERRKSGETPKAKAPKFSFAGGLQELTDTIGARLGASVRLNCPITQLRQCPGGWQVEAGNEVHQHSAVVLASPAHRLAELNVRSDRPVSLSLLKEMHYPPVASVVLGFRREDVEHPLAGFGALIPEVERFGILGTIFSSSLFPGRAPEGHVTLTSYVGGMRAPELARLGDSERQEVVMKDLRTLLGVKGEPTFVQQTLYPRAIPQYEVGFRRFKDCMDRFEVDAPGLFLAGHFRDGISLGDSIVAGHTVVNRVEDFLKDG